MGPLSVDTSKKTKEDSSTENVNLKMFSFRFIFLFLNLNASFFKQENVENLMTGMSKINENRIKLSASAIASIMDTENIQKIARDFASEALKIHIEPSESVRFTLKFLLQMPLRQKQQSFDAESSVNSVAMLNERKEELTATKLEVNLILIGKYFATRIS